jgi:hypothetical protein
MAIAKTTIQERSWGDVFTVIDRVVTDVNGGGASVQAADITDSTAIGRTVLTAADASAVRTAIGTVAATTATAGIVKQITFTAQQSGDFASLTAVTTAYNALLTKLITAGIMPAS